MNAPILQALDNDATKRLMMHNCIEDELGYPAPSSDKPYKAYKFVKNWKTWDDVPVHWREKMKTVFQEYADCFIENCHLWSWPYKVRLLIGVKDFICSSM